MSHSIADQFATAAQLKEHLVLCYAANWYSKATLITLEEVIMRNSQFSLDIPAATGHGGMAISLPQSQNHVWVPFDSSPSPNPQIVQWSTRLMRFLHANPSVVAEMDTLLDQDIDRLGLSLCFGETFTQTADMPRTEKVGGPPESKHKEF
jgi:hypothetical protein